MYQYCIKNMKYITVLAVMVFTLGGVSGVSADEAVGQVKNLTGTALVQRGGQEEALDVGAMLFSKDIITTGPQGQLGMTFVDNSMFSIGPKSELSLEAFRFNTTTHEGLFKTKISRGTLAAVSGKIAKQTPGAMTVQTPSAILGVRGTKFLVEVEGS